MKPKMFVVVRREVLDALLSNEQWRKRWNQTKTTAERACVVAEFCQEKVRE